MSKLAWGGSALILAGLLAAVAVAVAVGSPGGSVARAPQSPAVHATSLVTRCSSGLVPWPLAEARVPALKDLPDGGTIGIRGMSANQYMPCSWWVHFTAQPPVSLINQLATLQVGFGYTVGGSPSPARPTPITYMDRGTSHTAIREPIAPLPSTKIPPLPVQNGTSGSHTP